MARSSSRALSELPEPGPAAALAAGGEPACCPLYHEAIELVGKRWTGAIVGVLLPGPLRFCEIAEAVPELSDRLLSERMKELERRGLVSRRVIDGPSVRVEYALTDMGLTLGPALLEIKAWAHRWLGSPSGSATDDALPEADG